MREREGNLRDSGCVHFHEQDSGHKRAASSRQRKGLGRCRVSRAARSKVECSLGGACGCIEDRETLFDDIANGRVSRRYMDSRASGRGLECAHCQQRRYQKKNVVFVTPMAFSSVRNSPIIIGVWCRE